MISNGVACFRQATQRYLDEQYYTCGLEPWEIYLAQCSHIHADLLHVLAAWLAFWKSQQPDFATFGILAQQLGSIATAGVGADQQLGSQCSMLKSAPTNASADATDGDMTRVDCYHAWVYEQARATAMEQCEGPLTQTAKTLKQVLAFAAATIMQVRCYALVTTNHHGHRHGSSLGDIGAAFLSGNISSPYVTNSGMCPLYPLQHNCELLA